MRAHRKAKTIRVPIEVRAKNDDGIGMRVAVFMFAVLAVGGLLYAYRTQPDLFGPFASVHIGKTETTGAAAR
jgi:hypothetical protein